MTGGRRAAAGFVGAAAVALGAITWLALAPRAIQGGWKAMNVVASVEPSDAVAVTRLNAALTRLVPAGELRSSEPLHFELAGGRVSASVKVHGDDWDLAVYFRALARLSTEEPRARFEIASEPEGERMGLAAGSFGRRARAVTRFLAELDGPRPNLEGVFTILRLDAPPEAGDALELRSTVERQLAGRAWPHLAGALEYQAGAGAGSGVTVILHTDGDVRTLVALIDALQGAVAFGSRSLEPPACRLTLDGKEHRERTLAAFDDWFRLRDELAIAVGPTATPTQP